jgi:hypothetical protein
MQEKKNSDLKKSEMCWRKDSLKAIYPMIVVILLGFLMNACNKDQFDDGISGDIPTLENIANIFPVNLSNDVNLDDAVSVTFKSGTDASVVQSAMINLTDGSETVPGAVTANGMKVLFTASSDFKPDKEYAVKATFKDSKKDGHKHEYSWRFKTGSKHGYNAVEVASVLPADKTVDVPVASPLTVTFNKEVTDLLKKNISVSLAAGSVNVSGTVTFTRNTAVFTPASALAVSTLYNGKIVIGSGSTSSGDNNNSVKTFTWSFTTAATGNTGGGTSDTTPPTVTSTSPVNNTTSVDSTSSLTATFSEAIDPSTVSSSTFTLNQGSSRVSGSVTHTGTTATFTPTSALKGGTVYKATITTGVKDIAGNAITASYSWSFTTAGSGNTGGGTTDTTPPTVISTSPVNNTTSVDSTSSLTATFSEAINPSTITSSSFTLNQGSSRVSGSVTYTGTTAKFTPTSTLKGGTVYTATITTAVKDIAGNAITASFSWSFTTVAPAPTGLSFAKDVIPVLNLCNNCHTHPWTTSSVATTYYTNLVNAGYVNPNSPTSGKIYTKLTGGHPGSSISSSDIDKVLNWITQGSKNN